VKKTIVILLILVVILLTFHAIYSYRRYNVILITIDTLRPDYLSCYNPGAARTPNIDLIASKGVRFTHAYTLIPITMPSHTSILSSRQPNELGLFNNGDRFNHKTPLLSDMLRRKGYVSGAFVSLGVLARAFGLADDFEQYNDDFSNTNGRFYKLASEVNAVALPWIEQNKNKKFFAWIHYSDPHEPYIAADAPPDTEIRINGTIDKKVTLAKKEKITLNFTAHPGVNAIQLTPMGSQQQMKRFIDPKIFVSPSTSISLDFDAAWIDVKLHTGEPTRYFISPAAINVTNTTKSEIPLQVRLSGGVWDQDIEQIRHNYAAEVQFTDKYIGLLWKKLADLNLLDRTIIIVTADHGEGLKTHGILGHVDRLWNETTHVPLLIYYPNLGRRGSVCDRLVNLLDIAPTILDLLHIKQRSPLDGQSLRRSVSWSPMDWLLAPRAQRSWTFSATYTPEAAQNSFSVTNGTLKMIHTPNRKSREWEAYDLSGDPFEKNNLARYDRKKFNSLGNMRTLLERFRQEAEMSHNNRKNPELTDEEQQVLRNLGYVGGEDKH
jgi:arylsulfatase A-like enzyme